MPLDPRVKRFLDALNASGPADTLNTTPSERRAGLAELMKFGGPPPAVASVTEHLLPGPDGDIPARLYVAPAATDRPGPGIVYFHGGGMVAGSIDTHDNFARALAAGAGCRVVSVGYRLAPEHRFPAALDDALAAARHVRSSAGAFGIDPARLGLCGDSAGGTLAAAAAHALARSGDAPFALLLLVCPILDYSRTTPSRAELASGYLVGQSTLDHDLLHYLPGGTDPADPRVSPLCEPALANLPPTVIHTAEFDPLRDEGLAYSERLRHTGIPVSYTCHPGMIHLFYGLAGVIPYARTAVAQIGAELRAALA